MNYERLGKLFVGISGTGEGLASSIVTTAGETAGAVGAVRSAKTNYSSAIVNAKSQDEIITYQREKDILDNKIAKGGLAQLGQAKGGFTKAMGLGSIVLGSCVVMALTMK